MQLGLVLQQIPRILVGVQIVVLTEPALWVKVIGTNLADTPPVCGRQTFEARELTLPLDIAESRAKTLSIVSPAQMHYRNVMYRALRRVF